jgi:hypothetical protein
MEHCSWHMKQIGRFSLICSYFFIKNADAEVLFRFFVSCGGAGGGGVES